MKQMKKIVEKMGEEYILRQLAEENCELGQAALKLIRAIRGETPIKEEFALLTLLEETADVLAMIEVLRGTILTDKCNRYIDDTKAKKLRRMKERLTDKGNGGKEYAEAEL